MVVDDGSAQVNCVIAVRLTTGLHVAEQSLFVNIARLLWGFNLTLAKDANGTDIPVDFTAKGLQPGFLSVPKPYKCCTFPRTFDTNCSYHAKE